jgi:hypothetical protein
MDKIMNFDADVLIIGAGPSGLGAALFSARMGMKTLVAEAYGLPGGMPVIAEVQPFMVSRHQGVDFDYPVYQEWKTAMYKYLSKEAQELVQKDLGYAPRNINKDIAALAAEDLLLKDNVTMLYHHTLVDVKIKDNSIESVLLHSKSGLKEYKAKIYIDCTGDGDLASLAGCQYEIGNEDKNCQPMTLCFKLGNVNIPYIDYDGSLNLIEPQWRKDLNLRFQAAVKAKKLSCPREDVLLFPYKIQNGNIIHFNTTRVINLSGVDGADLAKAEVEARRQLRELFFWLRDEVPGFENAEIVSMGVQIGVRESRRIKGEFYLTKEHFTNCAKFPDAIARSNYHIDIHSPNGSGTYRECIPNNDYYEIPYRCLVPLSCNNLLVAGRPISSDVAVHSSLRIMPTAISIGQAAGCAAALAIENNCKTKEVDGVTLREKLKALGALLTFLLMFSWC